MPELRAQSFDNTSKIPFKHRAITFVVFLIIRRQHSNVLQRLYNISSLTWHVSARAFRRSYWLWHRCHDVVFRELVLWKQIKVEVVLYGYQWCLVYPLMYYHLKQVNDWHDQGNNVVAYNPSQHRLVTDVELILVSTLLADLRKTYGIVGWIVYWKECSTMCIN